MFKHSSILFLRHLPVWSALAGTILCLLLCTEDLIISYWSVIAFEVITITSGFTLIYLFSVYLGYCIIQRLGIYYTFFVILCVWLRRYPEGFSGMFGNYLHEAHIFTAAVGILYVALVIFLRGGSMCRNCKSMLHRK